jgi:hypothetical protein
MTKQLLAVVVVAVVLSTVIGFTIGSSTSPENANAATEQTEVVKQLKRLNVQMAALNMKTSALNSKTGDTQTAEDPSSRHPRGLEERAQDPLTCKVVLRDLPCAAGVQPVLRGNALDAFENVLGMLEREQPLADG